MMTTPMFPNITVKLSNENGNAFYIMSKVRRGLADNGVDQVKINEFLDEAMSGDYNDLLVTCMKWVKVT